MAGTIPSSTQVNGKHIRVSNGELSFSSEAWIEASNLDGLEDADVILGQERDISNAVNAAGVVVIRDVQLRYPGGDTSVLLPVSDVVLEYRTTAGKHAERRADTGKGTFASGYLVTYVSMGMPERSFDFLMARVRASADSRVRVDAPKVQHHDGYCWMPAKVPHTIKTTSTGRVNITPTVHVSFYDGENEYDAGNMLDVFLALSTSLVGSCTLSARLKHTRPRNAVDHHRFDLGLTVTGYQMMDTTRLRSPPLNNVARGLLVERAANSDLIRMLRDSSHEGDGGDVEGDGESEEERGGGSGGEGKTQGEHTTTPRDTKAKV